MKKRRRRQLQLKIYEPNDVRQSLAFHLNYFQQLFIKLRLKANGKQIALQQVARDGDAARWKIEGVKLY